MNDECCLKFDHAPWHDKLIVWNNKRFIKSSVKTIFYMPLGFGKTMKIFSELI